MTAVNSPEKDPGPQDEFDRLEQLQQRTKDAQEAWRKLLENLGKLEPTRTNTTEPEKPNAS